MTALDRLALRNPVAVFAAVGRDDAPSLDALASNPAVEMVTTPRHASVLLVAGQIRTADARALAQLHDQLVHPRATLWWGGEPLTSAGEALQLEATADPLPAIAELYRALLSGQRDTESHWLEDEPPNPWRGLGDHGQGGEGMMGGVPYGRMMPMPPTPDIRDGLALDIYTTRIGPFLPQLPAGLILEITLQGDILQAATIAQPPYPPADELRAPFDRLLHESMPLATIERARAAHHLGCIARVADLVELGAPATRCRIAASRIRRGEMIDIGSIRRALQRAGLAKAIPRDLGRIDRVLAAQLGGPAQRAAGDAIDTRADNADYARIGFRAVTQDDSDVRGRLEQWFDEAEQAMALVQAAAETRLEKGLAVEPPWAHRAPPLDTRFTDLLAGLEWGDALLVIASFDAAALCRMAPLEAATP